MYPLHHACRSNQSESIINILINIYPEASQIRDNYGNYPLQAACLNKSFSESVIKLLIATYPDALRMVDERGLDALYYLLENYFSESFIILLIETFPEAITRRFSSKGRYLLHYACINDISDDVIQTLMEINPWAQYTTDRTGFRPIDWLTERMVHKRNIYFYLLDYWTSDHLYN